MPKSQINEELLITEVQKHPCLYDIDSRHYKDTEMANNAWTAISQACETTAAECKSRWKSLRDRYVRMKREQKTKSGQGAKSKKPWKYANIMSFLARFVQEAETSSNLAISDDDADDQQQGDQSLDAGNTSTDGTMDVSTDSQSNPAPSTSFTSRPIPPKDLPKPTKRSRNQVDDPVGRAMLNYLQKEDSREAGFG
ncbi:transcription factor Adf-1-like [Haliotis asinina]|uniref:transcription factor Adf-1-like n=1 Tax=Haliotis asinina TaxID=109174 RepID=UPI003531FE8D